MFAALSHGFTQFAKATAHAAGKPATFIAAVAVILLWAVLGPAFGFSDTWQLIINTGTTIVTFLMVFLIQNTQNRDAEAVQIKLNELIRAVKGARNTMIDLEDLEIEDLDKLHDKYATLAEQARHPKHKKNGTNGKRRATRQGGKRAR
jgi:low affinity Fe/Cu permease